MKYVILVYGNPRSRETWDGLPAARRAEGLALLLDCESMDRAVEHAARIPEAAYGPVEVRPVMDLSAFES